jgi:hypothetical protein
VLGTPGHHLDAAVWQKAVAVTETAWMFSCLDTQLTRLGGPNFTQLPINRPHAPMNDNLRDGMHQTAVCRGRNPRHSCRRTRRQEPYGSNFRLPLVALGRICSLGKKRRFRYQQMSGC